MSIAWILSLPATLILLLGGLHLPAWGVSWDFAPLVDTNLWGGLMLTMLLAVVGIALSFPIGVLLALGRRGNLPVIKYFCVGYIELIQMCIRDSRSIGTHARSPFCCKCSF